MPFGMDGFCAIVSEFAAKINKIWADRFDQGGIYAMLLHG